MNTKILISIVGGLIAVMGIAILSVGMNGGAEPSPPPAPSPISLPPSNPPVSPITPVTPPPVSVSQCRPTGCSGQICADQDMVSTCEYRPEYVCYKNARCERQSNGQCGWTQTAELSSCLAGAQ